MSTSHNVSIVPNPDALSGDSEMLRLEALHRYAILDTLPEASFDDLTRLTARLCGTPMALLTLIDSDRQWFKSNVGLDLRQAPRTFSFCDEAIRGNAVFIVADAEADARFRESPLVRAAPRVRFYGGAPLITADGYAIGTLCVLDRAPRSLSVEQRNALIALSKQAMHLLEAHRELAEAKRSLAAGATQALAESEERLKALSANVPGMVYQFIRTSDSRFAFPYVSEGCYALFGILPEALQQNAAAFHDLILPEDRESYLSSMVNSAQKLTTWNWEGRIKASGWNDVKWINLRSSPRPLPGDAIQWEGMMANITQSKLSAAEVRASRERLRELQSHVETVKEQERTRISREIHDDIGGALTAMKIDLAWLTNRLPKGEPQLAEKAVSVDRLLDHVMETTRRIARDLRPGILDLGLIPAIEWQTQEFQKRTGISCDLRCAVEELDLNSDASAALFRVFQETLTNVAKHARATRVTVRLEVDSGFLLLTVNDDGEGIAEHDMAKPHSFGIRGMLERARHLGGKVEIQGSPGRGTEVRLQAPLASRMGPEGSEVQKTLF